MIQHTLRQVAAQTAFLGISFVLEIVEHTQCSFPVSLRI
jgi:hypothetical protein